MAGGFSIVNNLPSVDAQRRVGFSQAGIHKALGGLSSGLRLNQAGDDAAALGIANALRADVTAYAQATRNANDGIGMLQVADGGLSRIGGMLDRAVSLATQASSGMVGDEERKVMDMEYQQLLGEIDRVVDTTRFNGERLFSQEGPVQKEIYVGDTQTPSGISVSIAGSLGAGTQAMGLAGSSMATQDGARELLGTLNSAIQSNASWRGALGGQQNRIANTISTTQVQQQNLTAAESVLRDANMAEETVNLVKAKMLTQSGMASVAQANVSAEMVLRLFQ